MLDQWGQRLRRRLAYLIWPECREIGRANQVLVGRVNALEGAVNTADWWLQSPKLEGAVSVLEARTVLQGVMR